MKKFALLALVATISFLSGSNSQMARQKQSPTIVVEKYISLAASGNLKDISELVTGVPKSYQDAQMEESCRLNPKFREMMIDLRSGKTLNKGDGPFATPAHQPETVPTEDVTKSEPEYMQERAIYLNKILDTSINGNEAKITVELKSKEIETYRATRDIFMLNTEKGWKVFRVEPIVSDRHLFGTKWEPTC